MVGGGQGAFIGAVHRIAARLDDQYELVAGALSSDPARGQESAASLHIAPDRAYADAFLMAEAERRRPDPIDAVSIVTPNHLHAAAAEAFLAAGIHVICDKPLTTDVAQAERLVAAADRTGLLFAVTHNYTGYPMVREARALVAAGVLGALRTVQVEYAQDWLSKRLEADGHKQAAWRTDPARSGPAGAVGDIGTHAFNLLEFVTGLRCSQLLADLSRFVPGRALDDDARMLLRFAGGARGALWCSQVAVGNENGLRLRIYGEVAGLEWAQEQPNHLRLTRLGEPPQLLTRGGPGLGADAAHATRIPAGHPEGYLEGFAQIYADMAEQIRARLEGRPAHPESRLVPGVRDGLRGVQFIAASVESTERGGAWVAL
jgi:predicted dehydrogenase